MSSNRTFLSNSLLLADSYKVAHHLLYPPGTTRVLAYFESRGGKFPKTVFFGLQYILKQWLTGQFVTREMIDEADEMFRQHFGGAEIFNRQGWEYILEKHGGRLPLRIKAVPEGSVIPTRNVLFTVENTDDNVPWLSNYVETLLVQCWYPLTVCTNSYHQLELLAQYADLTADNLDRLQFMLHDFGYRGCSSVESAGIGGAAHLVNFKGTDTVAALATVRNFYGPTQSLAGFSIPATEHSTMTTWGRGGEKAVFEHIMKTTPDTSPVSVVVDSYDVYNMLENIVGGELRHLVEGRKAPLVVRPDSGDPPVMVVKVLDILEGKFGSHRNSKGYKVLPDYVRVIQGDGVSYETLEKILKAMYNNEWSVDNITFGSGGALLQRLDRDTQRCAYKCCLAVINGEEVEVYKDPVTDPGKTSKKGRLVLVKEDGVFKTVTEKEMKAGQENELVTVFEDGELVTQYSFEEIRKRAQLKTAKD